MPIYVYKFLIIWTESDNVFFENGFQTQSNPIPRMDQIHGQLCFSLFLLRQGQTPLLRLRPSPNCPWIFSNGGHFLLFQDYPTPANRGDRNPDEGNWIGAGQRLLNCYRRWTPLPSPYPAQLPLCDESRTWYAVGHGYRILSTKRRHHHAKSGPKVLQSGLMAKCNKTERER